jgi:hypothetical protein
MPSHPDFGVCPDPLGPLSRRELLRVGGTGLLGLSLPRLLAAREGQGTAKDASEPKADACIILMLNGGPSHIDMWDMKPDAPDNIRGEFKPIASSLTGVPVCEHLPKLSQQMHRCTLVRSMHHSVNNAHALAVYTAMTGHDRGDANVIVGDSNIDQPTPGAVVARMRPGRNDAVPHIALPYKTKEGAGGPPQPGFYGGWLGKSFDPMWVLRDPNAPDFSVPEFVLPADVSADRLLNRGQLLTSLNAGRMTTSGRPIWEAMGNYQQRALDVLTSDTVRKAFRLEEEPAMLREAYGRNIYGQSTLLARRLIEAGTRVATISWAPDANATWDTHGSNFKKLKDPLLPQFDAACGTLISDLADRGMLERTIVAAIGDFGRTPKVNNNDGGRDHWNYCYTIMLAGGGIKPGFIYGASDKTGAFPADKPTTPAHIVATLYRLMGVDPAQELHDVTGRPHRIVGQGEVLDELIA